MSQIFEMRLTQEQAEWVIHMDEIQEEVKKEIHDLQQLALKLAEYIGGVRSDVGVLTNRPMPILKVDDDDEFTQQLVRRLNDLL